MPDLATLEQEAALLETQLLFQEGLPHLYGQKMYRWQRQFFDSLCKYTTLVASNQSGKSAIQIRKCIHWATEKNLWPELWSTAPIQFWYLYPDGATATREFEEKWVREFLPRGIMQDHEIYGWKKKMRDGDIDYIRFNSGVTVYFKSYSQNVHNLQAGSVHALFLDEEIPWPLISELQMRITAYDGYMNFAFTATRGQEEWRRVVEEKGKDETWRVGEVDILKIQVSAYDCLYYEDGTPSKIWTVEKIEETKSFLHTQAQIDRRIYGKFVKDEGLKYPCFVRKEHIIEHDPINLNEGFVYAALDWGSGTNHQSSICFVWVHPTRTYGVVFDIWVGDEKVSTDAGSVVQKYKEMVSFHNCKVTQVFYDWACPDLKTIGEQSGLFFEKAEKGHDTGERILNTLFKFNMLKIMQYGSWDTLAKQLESLTLEESRGTKKKNAWDDAVDALRYAVTKVPWVNTDLTDKQTPIPKAADNRRSRHQPTQTQKQETFIEEEIDEWNEYINGFGFEDFDGSF